jgi:hypothetical protein
MAGKWKTVRVFISSTFRDMQAERDHLVRFVFPKLREALARRYIQLVDVDLRWGVTSEQNVVEVCRATIDRCSRFLCLLGNRYGSTLGYDRSVTADEIHYAALDIGESAQRLATHFFYLRDPNAAASVPDDQREFYCDPPGCEAAQKLLSLT